VLVGTLLYALRSSSSSGSEGRAYRENGNTDAFPPRIQLNCELPVDILVAYLALNAAMPIAEFYLPRMDTAFIRAAKYAPWRIMISLVP